MNDNQQTQHYNNSRNEYEDEIDLRDLLRILWNRKWLIIGCTLLFAIVAYGYSSILTPMYMADGKIALGNTGHEMYTQAASAKEVILSRDMMMKIIEEFDLKNPETGEYLDSERFKNNITISQIGNTRLLQIEVRMEEPALAQGIAKYIREEFIRQSEVTYLVKRQLVEELHQQYLKQYEQTVNSLEQNKQALTAIETNSEIGAAEKDLARVRLLDYIIKDENTITSLDTQIRSVQAELLSMEGAELFEMAVLPTDPVSPNKMLNLAIGLVLGAMVGVFGAFILEYFKNNPLRLNEK
jgi:uncharacterized protein involved in exopolysaccharide biosynthesis